MDVSATQSEYLFLMRGTEWSGGLSPQETQDALTAMMDWAENIRKQGRYVAGSPLEPVGNVIQRGSSSSIQDGPFIETKEAVGGYVIVRAATLEEAKQIASECPPIKHGLIIEVRPIVSACPIAERLGVEM